MARRPDRLYVGQHPWQRENVERNREVLERLADRLLAVGGASVVVPPDRPTLVEVETPVLLRIGRPFDAASAMLDLHELGDCHANAVELWRAGRGVICTGYALSFGKWRSHSWLRDPSGRVIETTEPRDAYFGYELDEKGSEAFASVL